MTKSEMHKFNLIEPEEVIQVTIRGKTYPVLKTGKGIPCLLICLGTPTFRSLSKNFIKNFQVFSSDMYWVKDNALENLETVSMETIVDDIQLLVEALNLEKYVIFAHSAYGIIALEFAKKYPNSAAGIIMVGTPVNSNTKVMEENNQIFIKLADANRKQLDKNRREEVANEDLNTLSFSERWLREYVYRDAPRYWHIPDFDCTELWKNIFLDKLLFILFEKILPKTDVLENLEKIQTPIFLAAGVSDYDCCPWMWKEVLNLPINFSMILFTKSGHWPHYEEAALFDESVNKWVEKIYENL